ncbi:MAG TPA: cytochrome c family protein [Alphaproteobacteria bacterium]
MKEPNLEWNKIFAAFLTAGIIAMFAGFVAQKLTTTHTPEKSVLDIDTSALESAAAGGPAGPVGPEPILGLIAGADIKRGEQLSKACTACHTFDKGGADRVGPNQWNLVMGPKAHRDGFAYSDALKALHGKGEKWTYVDLNHFLWKPAATVPGTKMNYLGLKKPEDRAALIAYLRTLSDSPVALPSDGDVKTEQAVYDAAQPKKEEAPAEGAAAADDAAGAPKEDSAPADKTAPAKE